MWPISHASDITLILVDIKKNAIVYYPTAIHFHPFPFTVCLSHPSILSISWTLPPSPLTKACEVLRNTYF